MTKGNWLTYEERKEIERLLKRLHSCSDIAQMLGRGRNTIIVEVRRNGGRDNYKANEAQEQAYKMQAQANDSRKEANAKNGFNPFVALQTRIDQIEMHLDILTDEIQRLRGNTLEDAGNKLKPKEIINDSPKNNGV